MSIDLYASSSVVDNPRAVPWPSTHTVIIEIIDVGGYDFAQAKTMERPLWESFLALHETSWPNVCQALAALGGALEAGKVQFARTARLIDRKTGQVLHVLHFDMLPFSWDTIDTIRDVLSHSFRPAGVYEGLTSAEREFITKPQFDALFKWATGSDPRRPFLRITHEPGGLYYGRIHALGIAAQGATRARARENAIIEALDLVQGDMRRGAPIAPDILPELVREHVTLIREKTGGPPVPEPELEKAVVPEPKLSPREVWINTLVRAYLMSPDDSYAEAEIERILVHLTGSDTAASEVISRYIINVGAEPIVEVKPEGKVAVVGQRVRARHKISRVYATETTLVAEAGDQGSVIGNVGNCPMVSFDRGVPGVMDTIGIRAIVVGYVVYWEDVELL